MPYDIILAVDYHDENTVIRQFDERTKEETTCTVPTTATALLQVVHQASAWLRQVRRLVCLRENLVNRRTALRNWINRYLAHETWESRASLWSHKGLLRLRQLLRRLPELDQLVVELKLAELEKLETPLSRVEAQMHTLSRSWPDAQKLDAVRGIGVIAAVAIAARI